MALKNIWKITLCFPREDVSTSKAGLMKGFLKQSRKENGSGFREVGIRSEGRGKKKTDLENMSVFENSSSGG